MTIRVLPALALTLSLAGEAQPPASVAPQSVGDAAPAGEVGPTRDGGAPTAAVGRLRGQARRPDGKPIVGATIVGVREQPPPLIAITTSDRMGLLAANNVPPGTWRVLFLAPGFKPGEVTSLVIQAPYRAVADLTLRPGFAEPPLLTAPAGAGEAPAVLVRVVDDQTRPLSGVRIRLEPIGQRADPARGETAEDGVARLPVAGTGPWRAIISRAGWTRLVTPPFEWGGGELTLYARLSPVPEGAVTPIEDLMPPPRLLTD